MARVLIERETIYTDEVNMIMEGKTAEEVIAFMDGKDDVNPLEKASIPVEEKTEKTDCENADNSENKE